MESGGIQLTQVMQMRVEMFMKIKPSDKHLGIVDALTIMTI